MKKEESKQIEDYLLLYKLPLDILLEVKDHMSTQIAEIQAEKEITFEKAFTETKLAWEKDLKPAKFKLLFQDEVPMIVKKLSKEKYWDILKKSLYISVLPLLTMLSYVYISKDLEMFTLLFRIQIGLSVIAPIIFLIINKKTWKFFHKDFKFQGKVHYTIYQNTASFYFLYSMFAVQVFNSGGTHMYKYLKIENSANVIQFLITTIGVMSTHVMIIFILFVLSKHKQTLKKIQKFIVE
ncbi:MAG: hypothetical protein KBS61_06370 [Chryseobacterium sp.]|nr:hypothetical protein [Candidatus Chryseobacterium enterohippi]